MARKQKKQKAKKRTSAKSSSKAKASARHKTAAKASARRRTGAKRVSRKSTRRRPTRVTELARGSQSVETVPLRRKARAAGASGGAGDYDGISSVEGADSESPKELLEEGQTFEAGIVSGVQNAPNADVAEVRTHEVPMDDVPEEYEDKDRP